MGIAAAFVHGCLRKLVVLIIPSLWIGRFFSKSPKLGTIVLFCFR